MKHYMSMLCFAFMSFFLTNKAAASLLLKQNPTPLESVSFAVSGESYQVARVTWLPDYLENNKGHGGNRTDDGGKGTENRDCATYGLLGPCPAHYVGKGVHHPVAGLTCYEQCACDTSYYKYTIRNCLSPKELSEECANLFSASQGITASPKQATKSLSAATISGQYVSGSGSFAPTSGLIKYAQCSCPAEYKQTTCSSNSVCEECDGKFKKIGCLPEYNRTATEMIKENASCLRCSHEGKTRYTCTCKSGYTLKKGATLKEDTCVSGCSGYPLTVCPPGGECDKCTDSNTTKYRLNTCDAAKGWKYGGGTCEAIPCPTGYTRGVTTCSSGSTKPHYKQNGMSGGLVCGMCTCNTSCDYSYFNLTVKPENASYVECTEGCGSDAKKRYHLNYCLSNYELRDGKCQKVNVCSSGTVDTTTYWCAVPSTDCASLGYNMTAAECCERSLLKCPFDSSKLSCF